ncbi:hypothetical protein [Rhizobium sp. CECT 9324]|uniref:hypothetical protein n=1 Tax=Rhizobium sp. CECT 9324 TaxID=2845820 RepID=UPI001E33CD56|nr:hypothetical protein [Rhizobium sp. CECT 9324]
MALNHQQRAHRHVDCHLQPIFFLFKPAGADQPLTDLHRHLQRPIGRLVSISGKFQPATLLRNHLRQSFDGILRIGEQVRSTGDEIVDGMHQLLRHGKHRSAGKKAIIDFKQCRLKVAVFA